MSSFWLGYKIVFCKKNKMQHESAQHRQVATMTTWWMKGGGNQAYGAEKKEHILPDSNYFYIEESPSQKNKPCLNQVKPRFCNF